MENSLLSQIKEILSTFDDMTKVFSMHEISGALNELRNKNVEREEEAEFVLRSEGMAFGFAEMHNTSDNHWGTYYGPLAVMKDEQGQWIESPSIQLVIPEMISYWEVRAQEATNPILKVRYADLVWDFSRKITGNPADLLFAQIVIDATVDIVKRKIYQYEVDAIKKIKRGLSIALSISDKNRIELVRDTMVSFEDEIAIDSKAGLWGFCFDELLDNKNIPLSKALSRKIILDMEQRLERITKEDGPDTHSAEIAVIRLASYYRKWNRIEESIRVLRIYGQSVLKTVEKIEPMTGSMWVEQLYALYIEYGMREDADSLTGIIKNLGEKMSESMKTISHEFSVTKDEMDNYTDTLTDGSLHDALARIAIHYVPDPEEIKKQVIDLSNETPLHSLISIKITDWEGRPVAKIGSVEDDLDGRIIHQTSQNMSFSSVFLRATMSRLFSKFNPSLDEVLGYIFQSPLFMEGNKEIVSVGVKAYISGDHIVAAHVLIPQVEHAIRHLLKMLGAPIYKPGRNGALFLRTLDELLRDEYVSRVFGERGTSYLRILLTDQRGWNLRNDICHSTINPERFSWAMTDRIFHVILLFALIREKSDEGKE